MSEWRAKMAWGWRSAMPPEVQDTFNEAHDQGKMLVLNWYGVPHLSGNQGGGGSIWYGHGEEYSAVGLVFSSLGNYLERLADPTCDVASIVFFNFKAEAPPFSVDPPDAVKDMTAIEGLAAFCNMVRESTAVAFSKCEWVMLTCERVVS
jgi:hypothetical protein